MQHQTVIRKAKKLWQQGQVVEASNQLGRYLAKNPKNPAVRLALAESLVGQSNEARALQVLAEGLQHHPDNEKIQLGFVSLIRSLRIELPDNIAAPERKQYVDLVGGALGRALAGNWLSANVLAKPACYLVLADPEIGPLPDLGGFEDLSADVAAAFLDNAPVRAYLGHDLLNLIMEHALVVHPELELALASIRKAVLRTVSEQKNGNFGQDKMAPFLCNLALNLFQSEYAFHQDEGEEKALQNLREIFAEDPAHFIRQPNLILPVLGAYMPLHEILGVKDPDQEIHPLFATLWREQVLEPMREEEIKPGISTLGDTSDAISLNVQKQYEENPYPRWRRQALETRPVHLRDFLQQQFSSLSATSLPDKGGKKILIAGCGTGSHPIHTASRFRDAEILAMDLSLTSLAHAARKTEELGISNIRYLQGDLLQCGEITEKFDLVESIGVLHHLENPGLGLKKLVELLAPGGFMWLAFYSRAARAYARAAQSFAKQKGFEGSIEGIRQCRAWLISLQGEAEAAKIVKDFDFYSASGCRDLIMHVQEHQFDLGDLRRMITSSGLSLTGFVNLPRQVHQAYGRQFPNDVDLSGWENLELFEKANPGSFAGMYHFWCRKD